MSSARVRYPLHHIQYLYDSGENRSMLENLIRAFRGIQAYPPDDENSFFYLASLHGVPFDKPGDGAHTNDKYWWGGYCWHDTILFPNTWHRIYLLKLEDALRSVPGRQDVTLPFWDELSHIYLQKHSVTVDHKKNMIPHILTSPTFDLDGCTIHYPLFSYKLQKELDEKNDNGFYSKKEGYETVRYPLSGLMGTPQQQETHIHNAAFPEVVATKLLNDNVSEWLRGKVQIPDIPGEPDDKTKLIHAEKEYSITSC